MALTAITFRRKAVSKMSRGNVGTLVAVCFPRRQAVRLYVALPATSDVKSGVVYGHQGTEFTGSFAGGSPNVAY